MSYIKNNSLRISTRMATMMGVFLPFIATIGGANQVFELVNDYMLGGVLLISVYLVSKRVNNSISYSIAAWGFASGALFIGFLTQFEIYAKNDPGIFPTQLVAIGKGLILGYMLTGLYLVIQANSAKE